MILAVMSVEVFLEYLILREVETEKKVQRREAEVERTTWLYVLQGGGVVDTKTSQTAPQTELQHRPYGCYLLLPLFFKTKYFFK